MHNNRLQNNHNLHDKILSSSQNLSSLHPIELNKVHESRWKVDLCPRLAFSFGHKHARFAV